MKSLSIWLLGTPRVVVDGAPWSVDTRKATGLLAFLAVTGHAHSRAVVASLLWPDAPTDQSRNTLRRTLSTLRAALGDGRVVSDRDSIALDLEGAWFDLAAFRRVAGDPAADLAALIEAGELHRDDLLAGFALRDSPAFDDWQRDLADAIRRERAALLDRVVDLLTDAGRFDDGVALARQRLGLDPLHEPTHRRLIELYGAAGRRGDAIAQYRECVRVLDRELAVAPLGATTAAYDAISTGIVVAAGVERPPPERVGELPLVGRAVELRRLTEAFEAIVDDGAAIVIEGESGVGKTRLAAEAIGGFARRGARVIVARAHAGERGLAYGALAQLLQAAIASRDEPLAPALRDELARLLPALGAAPGGDLEQPGARLRFLESACDVIAGASHGKGVVVFVDDLQWCDSASLDALAYLARRLRGRRLLLLCTRRSDEPDPERRYAPLTDRAQRVALARLRREHIIDLARQMGLDQAAADEVFRDSEGLAAFVAELLRPGRPEQPSGGVREAIEARLDAASEAAAQVLGAAALIGRTFDPGTIQAASGRPEEEVALALEELVARGLVNALEDAYEFGHERLRVLAEERLGPARRRALHRRIGDALRGRRAEPAVFARHYELAGQDPPAAAAHAAAGDRARTLGAGAEAIAHYETALALGHPDLSLLHEAIGDLLTLRGEYRGALAAYDAAAAHCAQPHAGRLEHKLGGIHERRGDWQRAERHYQQALGFGADPAAVRSDLSRIAWRHGRLDEARTLALQALAVAEQVGADGPAAQAHNILGLLGCGREHLERSLELSSQLVDPTIRIAALNNLARALADAGELRHAEERLGEALSLCAAQGDKHREAALRNNLADVLHKAGRHEGASGELERAVSILAAIGSEGDVLYPGVWDLLEW